MTTQYENPSAGKFGPPRGQERFEAPKALRIRSWWTAPLAILYFVVRLAAPRIHGRGWLAVAGAALAAALAMADALVVRKLRDPREGTDQLPSSPDLTH